MNLFIDTTDVLRNTFLKAEQIYRKYYIDEFSKEKTMHLDGDEWEEDEEVDTFEYSLNLPVTSFNLIEHFKFPEKDDVFDFFYVDFPMQIFGHSPSMHPDTFNVLNSLYEKIRDNIDVTIISDEIQKSKPATLFFLSKYGSLIENIRFYSSVTLPKLLDDGDIIVTANPNILKDVKDKNKIIKVETSYNKEFDFEYTIKTIDELEKKLNEINII